MIDIPRATSLKDLAKSKYAFNKNRNKPGKPSITTRVKEFIIDDWVTYKFISEQTGIKMDQVFACIRNLSANEHYPVEYNKSACRLEYYARLDFKG